MKQFEARLHLLAAFARLNPASLPKVCVLLLLHKLGYNTPFSLRLLGRRIYFPSTDELYLVMQNFVEHIYDVDVHAPQRIIDLGANVGIVSIFYALKYPHAVIDAYEPDPVTFRYLQKNTRGLNVHCHQVAVADTAGCMTLYRSARSVASSLSPVADCVDSVVVRTITPEQLGHADILKIDIEGAEQQLLKHSFDATVIVGESDDQSREIIRNLFPTAVWRMFHIYVVA